MDSETRQRVLSHLGVLKAFLEDTYGAAFAVGAQEGYMDALIDVLGPEKADLLYEEVFGPIEL